MDAEALIVGASFAGLAVARELGSRALVVDRMPVGEGQTSACGTTLAAAVAWGGSGSVRQVYVDGYLHAPRKTVRVPLAAPWCTIDYPRFCRALLAESGARFVQARVIGRRGRTVLTDRGEIKARLIVDAAGWRRALLAGHDLSSARVERSLEQAQGWPLNSGLEVVVPDDREGIHFWVGHPALPDGIGWIFPAGHESRVGVGSYRGVRRLLSDLDRFAAGVQLNGDHRHGGIFPAKLRSGYDDGVFLVGDSAGQCVPLTGEGIRPALYFGWVLGRQLKRVLDGAIDEAEAVRAYRDHIDGYRSVYGKFRFLQVAFVALPAALQPSYAVRLASSARASAWFGRYTALFHADGYRPSARRPGAADRPAWISEERWQDVRDLLTR